MKGKTSSLELNPRNVAAFSLASLILAACAVASAAPAAPAARTPSRARFQSPGQAQFSDGARLSIVYVGGETSEGPAWKYDGTPLGVPDPKKWGSYSSGAFSKGTRGVAIAFEVTGMPPRDPDADPFRVLVPKLGGKAPHGMGLGGSTTITGNYLFTVPEGWKVTEFQMGRGFGPYKKVAESLRGEGSLEIHVTPMGQTTEQHQVNGETVESRHSSSQINFVLPGGVVDQDWRLVAYDAKGKRLNLYGIHETEDAGVHKVHASCSDAPESIDRFVLEARKFEWVTIKGVHLYPGNGTIRP